MFLLLSLAGIAANAGLSYHYMKLGSPDNAGSLWDSLVSGTGMIFGMGDGLQGMYGKTKYAVNSILAYMGAYECRVRLIKQQRQSFCDYYPQETSRM